MSLKKLLIQTIFLQENISIGGNVIKRVCFEKKYSPYKIERLIQLYFYRHINIIICQSERKKSILLDLFLLIENKQLLSNIKYIFHNNALMFTSYNYLLFFKKKIHKIIEILN